MARTAMRFVGDAVLIAGIAVWFYVMAIHSDINFRYCSYYLLARPD